MKSQLVLTGLPDIVNKAAKDVALRSIKYMPAVPRSVISDQLRTVISTREYSKTGKKLKRAKVNYAANNAAMMIILWRLRGKQKGPGAGQPIGLGSHEELIQLANAMANGRVRSGSFLKAGELAAAQAFGGPGNMGDGETHLYHAKGGGTLATLDHLVAEVRNDVPTSEYWNSNSIAAYAQAEQALQSGTDDTEADLLVYIDRQLAKVGFE